MTTTRKLIAALAGIALAAVSTVEAATWRDPDYAPVEFHHKLGALCDRAIDAALDQRGIRLLVSAPPRHGKTELIARAAPIRGAIRAQQLGRKFAVLYATASNTRAEEVSRRVRSACERIYRETGDPWWAPSDKWAVTEWETQGGFSWNAVGVGASTGGIGCHLLIMDDLIGSAARYTSRASRESIVRAVEEDLLSRLMDGGSALHMETRRGINDTTAYISENYGDVWEEHVWRCYDPERGYLWPEKYGAEWRALNPHLTDSSPIWRSLYQQEPIPEGGTLIAREWLDHVYPEHPQLRARACTRVIIGADLSLTGKNDPAAAVVIGVQGPFRDILWAGEFMGDYPAQRQWLREVYAEWRAHGMHVELAAGGDGMVAELQQVIGGVVGHRPRGSKAIRMSPFLPSFASGQIRMPAQTMPWCRNFRDVLTSVSGHGDENDHLFDATSVALHGESAMEMPVVKRGVR